MWDVILSILSVAGILLLAVLGLLFVSVLAMLFCPVTYRIRGERNPGETRLDARVSWLFGMLQIRYSYPEPGTLIAKLLWRTVFDSGKKKEADVSSEDKKTGAKIFVGLPGRHRSRRKEEKGKAGEPKRDSSATAEASGTGDRATAAEKAQTEQTAGEETRREDSGAADAEKEQTAGFLGKISRIKYTIQKICDRIRVIWSRITCFTELLQEENTVALWEEVKRRLGRVLQSVRPRRFRAELLFGTGSPDTTGLAFGFYGMLSPFLGQSVCVTPDFTQKILEGSVDISGSVTGFVLVWNGFGLLLDKKLHLFLKRLKSAAAWQG